MVDTFAVLAGWLIDGRGGPIRQGVRLAVSDGMILAIEQTETGHSKYAKILDFSDCTILPGMVDSHVHLAMAGENPLETRKKTRDSRFESRRPVIARNLRQHLANGVVAVRDGGDRAGHALRYIRKGLSQEDIPVLVLSPGWAWHAPGRYGRFLGRTPSSEHSLAESLLKEDLPADHVKIINSGLNSLSDFARETPPQFELEELRAAVRAVHALGLKTMVHANGKEAVRVALEAGCDSLEHGYFMGKDNLLRMAEKRITWVPTVFAMESYARMMAPGSRESEIAGKNRDHQLLQIQTARACGVKMALGTDAGSPGVGHGRSLCEEMGLFVRAGLPLEETLQCATARGASLLGLDDKLGTLRPGLPATFLVFRGRPEGILDPAGRPEKVYIAGRAVADFH